MDIAIISNRTFVGKCLRWPLRLIPPGTIIPILQGRLKGKKWIVGTHTHGCWLGSYEHATRILFEKSITNGNVVFDIGAHCGFYTLLASELAGRNGQIFAFEPLPRNLYYLKEHLRLNKISNVTVVEASVSDECGMFSFDLGMNHATGRLSAQGSIQVKAVSLDFLIDKGELPCPDYLKIDVEGGEIKVLSGAKNLLSRKHPSIFLATHGEQIHRQACGLLESLSYRIQPIYRGRSGAVFAYSK